MKRLLTLSEDEQEKLIDLLNRAATFIDDTAYHDGSEEAMKSFQLASELEEQADNIREAE